MRSGVLENNRAELAARTRKAKQKDLEVMWKRQQGFQKGDFVMKILFKTHLSHRAAYSLSWYFSFMSVNQR